MNRKIAFFFIILFSCFANGQNKGDKIDSLIIKVSLDPGSGPEYYLGKVFPSKKKFDVKYLFYTGFNREGFIKDSAIIKLSKEIQSYNFDDVPDDLLTKFRELRSKYVIFYSTKISLQNADHKNFLAELQCVFKLSKQDIINERKPNSSYIHGVMASFSFFKGNFKHSLVGSALEKDHYKSLYNLLTHSLDLYRNKFVDDEFNSKTLNY